MRKFLYPILYCSLLCVYCGKTKITPSPPVPDTLPPITQEGKNTIGSLLNGQVFIPKGNVGRNNPSIQYDPTDGSFSVYMYHIDKKDSVRQRFQIGSRNLHNTGIYVITTPRIDVSVFYIKSLTGTNRVWEYDGLDSDSVKQTGTLTISKLDLTQRIISGVFTCTLIKKNSDTMRITDGRFDVKF